MEERGPVSLCWPAEKDEQLRRVIEERDSLQETASSVVSAKRKSFPASRNESGGEDTEHRKGGVDGGQGTKEKEFCRSERT